MPFSVASLCMIKRDYVYLFSKQSNRDKIKHWWEENYKTWSTPFEIIPDCNLLDSETKPDNILEVLESKMGIMEHENG